MAPSRNMGFLTTFNTMDLERFTIEMENYDVNVILKTGKGTVSTRVIMRMDNYRQ